MNPSPTRTRPDRRILVAMAGFVIVLHLVGFGGLFAVAGGGAVTVGLGLLAYTFGLRHAFDADHIAAIDNVTRSLVADTPPGRSRPVSVGLWFALGHSTIVLALALLLAVGVRAVVGPLQDETSTLHTVAGVWGPSISGAFLWALGLVNLAALIGIVRIFRRMRAGDFDEAELERHLAARGLLARLLAPVMRRVSKPRHIYPVGVLFGLGFDTATEVGLLAITAGAAASAQLSFAQVMVLPILFAAGMCLADTLDGVFMSSAYEWAFDRPVRKVYYNLVVTTVSVVVALGVGTVQLASAITEGFSLDSGPMAALAGVNLDHAGYTMVAAFAVLWLAAVAVWRWGRLEDRWTPLGR